MSTSADAPTPPRDSPNPFRDAPRKPQQLDKHVRVSRCIAKLRLPTASGRAENVFQCQLEKHDEHTAHEHRGVIHMANDTLREFTITWYDGGVAQLYKQARTTIHRRKDTHDNNRNRAGSAASQ